jgi:hypothetical protein
VLALCSQIAAKQLNSTTQVEYSQRTFLGKSQALLFSSENFGQSDTRPRQEQYLFLLKLRVSSQRANENPSKSIRKALFKAPKSRLGNFH